MIEFLIQIKNIFLSGLKFLYQERIFLILILILSSLSPTSNYNQKIEQCQSLDSESNIFFYSTKVHPDIGCLSKKYANILEQQKLNNNAELAQLKLKQTSEELKLMAKHGFKDEDVFKQTFVHLSMAFHNESYANFLKLIANDTTLLDAIKKIKEDIKK